MCDSLKLCVSVCRWVGGRLIKGDLEDKAGGDGFNVVDKEQIVFKALKPICHRKKQCDHIIEGTPHEMLFLCKRVHFLFERIFILFSIQSERQVPVPSASARK